MKNEKIKLAAIKLDEIKKATPTPPEEPQEFDVSIPNGNAIRIDKILKSAPDKTEK